MHSLVSTFLLISSCLAAPYPKIPDANISRNSLPSRIGPLEQLPLLATGTASGNTDATPILYPLAAAKRSKRKPKKFKPQGEPRFRPTSNRKAGVNILQRPNSSKVERVPKSLFSGFLNQSRSSSDKQISFSDDTDQTILEAKVTTAQPSLILQDYVGTPVPEDSPTDYSGPSQAKPTFPISFVSSNDIGSDKFDQSALFERLQSITGAQPVGVTRNIARHTYINPGHAKQNKHKKISSLTRRRGSLNKNPPEEGEHIEPQSVVSRKDYDRQLSDPLGGKQSSRGASSYSVSPEQEQEQGQRYAALLPPRQKKSQKVKKKNFNKSFVGTLDRYQYKNEDGSITWGYQNEDGGFKEETIGMDCITHGRYGYTDPSGEQREYGYTSGVRCDPHARKVGVSDTGSGGSRGRNGNGFFDYTQNRTVHGGGIHTGLATILRVTVVVNQQNKARGRRY